MAEQAEAPVPQPGEVAAKDQRLSLKRAETKGRKIVEKKNVALKQLKIEYVSVDDIKPNAYNPNRQSEHEFELLCRSMEEDGFTQPCIVHRASMTIVDGEHRWRGAKAVGYKQVPVCFVDMTPEQMRIATLRHNRARGSEDMELTAQVLRDLQELGAVDWAQDSLMLSDAELNKLLEDVPAPEALAAEEYSEAWTPDATAADGMRAQENGVAGSTGQDAFGATRNDGATAEAADALRTREQRIAAAKSEEERQQVVADTNIYRLSLVYTDEQAKTIKAALGDAPAVRLLEICKDWLQRRVQPEAGD